MTQTFTSEQINDWYNTPILFQFKPLEDEDIKLITSKTDLAEFKPTEKIRCDNAYYHQGLDGALPVIYARVSVVERITQLSESLPKNLGIYIFDVFRTIDTQVALYEEFKQFVHEQNPDWDHEQVKARALEFVSHPYEKSRFEVPLHNSGGAIDLGFYDIDSGKNWDFGTEIDAITDLSYTDYFERDYAATEGFSEERWLTVRRNRRLLYHAMHHFGFTNFPNEWWHFDLGDCLWAKIYARDYIYPSMESLVREAAA